MTEAACLFLCSAGLSLAAVATAPSQDSAPAAYRETYRPQFHFTARTNWLNDPNGLVYYAGEYHLFFQHNPEGINWGNMTWGHAVSPDLVHWRQLDHALRPDALGTIFSGSAVVDWHNTAGFQQGLEKTLVAFYTAAGGTSPQSQGRRFTQCLAYSNDRGRTWTRYEHNPILDHIVGENRDPKVIWYAPGRMWIMVLYKDGNDFAFFGSVDMKVWTHLQDLTVPGCSECPDFFPLPIVGNPGEPKWVFTAANGHYLIGAFDGRSFTPEVGPLPSDWGGNYYAVQTYSDIPEADGRRIQIAWMRDGRYPQMPFNQQMSFPCEMTLRRFPEGLRICRQPVREIESLRGREHAWATTDLSAAETPLSGVSGDLYDIILDIAPGEAVEVGLEVKGEPIRYTAADGKLTCLNRSAEVGERRSRLGLRVLVDRTSIEVFADDGRVVMTSCFLPDPHDRSLAIYAIGGAATLHRLQVYELQSAWAARSPTARPSVREHEREQGK